MIIPPLAEIIPLLLHYKYRLILPIAVVEGPILTIICAFLMRLGYFHFWPLYLLVISGDLIGDFFWYCVGHYGIRRLIPKYGRFVGLDPETMEKIAVKFKRHQNKALLISKMTSGFGFAAVTLTTAGAIKIPVKNFFFMNLIGGAFWSGLMVLIGYSFGHFYERIDVGFRLASLIVFLLVIVALSYGFQRYMRTTINDPQ